MFIFYILHSSVKNYYYAGHTGDAIEERLRKHNSNYKGFTDRTGDWKIVYRELYDAREEANKREREVKVWKSRIKIEALKKKLYSCLEHSDHIGRVGDSIPSTPTKPRMRRGFLLYVYFLYFTFLSQKLLLRRAYR